MINLVNDLIEVNLRLLYTARNNFLNLNDFRDQTGKPFKDPNAFVRLLRIKKLVIKPFEDKSCFQLTEYGKEICKNGGWLQHLKSQSKIQSVKVTMELKKMNKKSLVDFFISKSKVL